MRILAILILIVIASGEAPNWIYILRKHMINYLESKLFLHQVIMPLITSIIILIHIFYSIDVKVYGIPRKVDNMILVILKIY